MTSVILNIILLILVVGPMAYFLMGNKKDKARKNEFRSQAADQGLSLDKSGLFQDSAVGIDTKQSKLCFTDQGSLKTVNLADISECSVSRSYSNENVHNQETKVLKRVHLCLKSGGKEINIPVFNQDNHPHPGNDLLTALEWEKIINAAVKKS